ncbi:histone acetyltransferase MYST2 [Phyllosticta citrichinensis]|uniref:Histone acetyltransferase n=1 Tax=Phyllosticta citrichinensis TaxID=1130410 RepID=A0ABR1Y0H8_9PEZI
MATEPSRLLGQGPGNNAGDDDSDVDAEHEEDVDMIQPAPLAGQDLSNVEEQGMDIDAGGEDEDAEGEEVDDEDAGEPVGAVKIQAGHELDVGENDEDAEIDSSSEDAKSSGSEADPESESESDAGNDWEGQSDTAEEADAEILDPNRCVFCGQDEEHDPSEEFEEYLSCAVCGDNSHRQCARDANSLKTDDDAENWRCPTCMENGLQADEEETPKAAPRRRSSAPKLTRDLLPTSRGTTKPDSHSVFNTLIHPDDPMDGSRALRKRKADSEEQALPLRSTRKRRRSSQTQTASEGGDDDEGSSVAAAAVNSQRAMTTDGETRDSEEEGSQAVRTSRRTRPRRSTSQKVDRPGALIMKSTKNSLVIAFTNLDTTKLRDVLSSTLKQKKRRARDRARRAERAAAAAVEEPEVSHYPALHNNFHQFFGFPDRDADDTKSKPYGGILSEAEADTSKTFPQAADRKRFEEARLKAEDDWKKKTATGSGHDHSRTPKVSGPPSKIKCINFGGYEIDTWHAAPYPEEYSRNKVLYICEFCLKYMNSDYVAWRHKLKCPAKHPPGDEIYRDGRFSFFEVDGRKNPVYCQNLCLLAKLFLGSKTLYYDVEPFLFYVMAETDEYGCHFVGYFSKEKRPSSLNNVSCILVLPIHQRKGFGHMLIEFSYLLTRVEKKTGSPEKPLSDMGLVSYRSYWRLILCYNLINQKGPISITQLSEQTGMTPDDIVSALEGLRALVRDPVTKQYALRLDYDYFKFYIEKFEAKKYPQIKPDCLVWTPYVMGRNNLAHYDEGPPLHTVAQRDGDGEEKVAPEEGVQQEIAKESSSQPPQTNGHPPEEKEDAEEVPTKQEDEGEPSTQVTAPEPPGPQAQHRPTTPLRRRSSAATAATAATSNAAEPTATSNKSDPSTPKTNGFHHASQSQPAPSVTASTPAPAPNATTSAIPPTRFEVFPPIPGAAARKRGRPFSSSSATARRTGTPARTSTRSSAAQPETPLAGHGTRSSGRPAPPTTVRRTRSKLGEMELLNGLGEEANTRGKNESDDDESEDDEEDDDDMEDAASSAALSRGRRGSGRGKGKGVGKGIGKGKGKGKGKSIVEVVDELDEDAEGEDVDVDAVGEDDPDA